MLDLFKYWQHLNGGTRASSQREFESVAKAFHKTIRKPIAELQRTDIVAYRDHLLEHKRARSTVSKLVGMVSTLLQTAYDAGELPQNVARGLKIPKPKVVLPSRRSFTDDEIGKLLRSPVYSQGKRYAGGGGEAAAWVPLIGLATGMRLEEICQLRTDDLRIDPEHGPLLIITDQGESQRVKTATSRRIVPVHKELVRAGLLSYHTTVLEAEQAWLFPALQPDHDGRRSGNFGKWFARYLRSPNGCGITDPAVVFHATRHSFKSLCRKAGIEEEVHDALTGHAGVTVGRQYGDMPIAPLVDAVGRIRFPVSFPVICV